ncbi:MAG: AraC family transcriptional regulator [Rhizobium sp.]|nr:AraC family transcriptional regulator [Rhizobium sp.]
MSKKEGDGAQTVATGANVQMRHVGSAGVTLTRLRHSDFETIQPALPDYTFSVLLAGRSRPWRDIGDGLTVPKGAEGYRHQGAGILTPADTSALWRVEGNHDCLIFSFPKAMVARMLDELMPAGSASLDRLTEHVVQDPIFAAVSTALWEQETKVGTGGLARAYGDHGVALILARLAQEAEQNPLPHHARNAKERLSPGSLRRSMDYMRSRVADDPSLEEIAAAAGLSQFHFLRAFKTSTGRTPFQWLQDFRIELACRLLAATGMPLAQLALDVGFKNQSHFTNVFRRATGTTPAQWRARARG